MICQSCRDAGDVSEFIRNSPKDGGVLTELMVSRAHELHEACPGGTHCPCQHHVPEGPTTS